MLLGNLTKPIPPAYGGRLKRAGVDAGLVELLERCVDTRTVRPKDGQDLLAALKALKMAPPPKPAAAKDAADQKPEKRRRLLSRSRVKRAKEAALESMRSIGRSASEAFTTAGTAKQAGAPLPPVETMVTGFRDHPLAPHMVLLPRGEFELGSPPTEPGRTVAEGPTRRVRIDRVLAVAVSPITFDEWDASAPGKARHANDEGWGRGARPVINVSWTDAQSYAAWLREITGKPYRLLSEAEWEFACRAGQIATPYFTGAAISTDRANFDGRVSADSDAGAVKSFSERVARTVQYKSIFRGQTTPVGEFLPNGFGLRDMHGNVWEWVEDTWHPSHAGASEDGAARGGGDEAMRVMRGGSWRMGPQALRSANRYARQFRHRSDHVGFRVSRDFDEAEAHVPGFKVIAVSAYGRLPGIQSAPKR